MSTLALDGRPYIRVAKSTLRSELPPYGVRALRLLKVARPFEVEDIRSIR